MAEGIIVQSIGPVDDNAVVISDDYSPGTEISQGSQGSIEIDSKLVGAYRSFDVVELLNFMAPVKAITERMGRHPELTPEPEIASYVTIQYEQYTSFNSVDYRWQQIGANSFLGILLEEEDDNLHVQTEVDPPAFRHISEPWWYVKQRFLAPKPPVPVRFCTTTSPRI